MPITVIATPSAVDANSYVLVTEADAYVNTYELDTAKRLQWSKLSADDKARLVILATRQLDMYMNWEGYRTVYLQALDWPRTETYQDGRPFQMDVIPNIVKDATTIVALWMMANGAASPVEGNANYDSIELGPIKIDFNESKSGQSKAYLPDDAVMMLRDVGSMDLPAVPGGNTLTVAKLTRT